MSPIGEPFAEAIRGEKRPPPSTMLGTSSGGRYEGESRGNCAKPGQAHLRGDMDMFGLKLHAALKAAALHVDLECGRRTRQKFDGTTLGAARNYVCSRRPMQEAASWPRLHGPC
jgi:hypothetical protein